MRSHILGPVLVLVLSVAPRAVGDPPLLFSTDGAAPIPLLETPTGIVDQTARACAGCHTEIYEEWRGSMHSAAWNDSQFQEVWRSMRRDTGCLNCHSPLTAQQPLASGGGFRPTLQAEGVTCAACHIRDGAIVGAGTSTGEVPHPVTQRPDVAEATFCASCHQLSLPGRAKGFYDTYREWRASDWAKRGVGCRECHMPLRTGNVATGVHRAYRSHELLGGHTDALLQRALTVTVELDKPRYEPGDAIQAVVVVRNTGAGHAVPSGDPAHQVRLIVGLADTRGEFLEKKETMFARKMPRTPPYRERADTRLAPGEERRIPFSTRYPGGMGEHYIIVQLSYHLMAPERAEELGIPIDVTGRVFDSQIIPITP